MPPIPPPRSPHQRQRASVAPPPRATRPWVGASRKSSVTSTAGHGPERSVAIVFFAHHLVRICRQDSHLDQEAGESHMSTLTVGEETRPELPCNGDPDL